MKFFLLVALSVFFTSCATNGGISRGYVISHSTEDVPLEQGED